MRSVLWCVTLLFLFQPSVFGQGLYGVHSRNGVDVWAVGTAGTIYRSYDGGDTWVTNPQGTQTLRSVYSMNVSVWAVGDNGAHLYSTNSGGSWTVQTINGGITLRSIFFVNSNTGWTAGNGGSILKTTDGGLSWSSQTSGTSQTLHSIWFNDAFVGYAAGDAGSLLKTTNGGAMWASTAGADWTRNISSVGASGSTLYVTGADGFCCKSTNGGSTWATLNFRTDSQSDVSDVFVVSKDEAFFAGGGGYIRSTANGGASFNWGMHGMHAPLSDVFFYDGSKGWVCGGGNLAVLRTTNGGTTWLLPSGTTVTYGWVQKLSNFGAIGNTFVINGKNKEHLYVALGGSVFMSANRGETWTSTATIAGGGSTHSFYISPKDTNLWVVANTGGGDAIKRSTNRGGTWTTTIAKGFTSYGMPLEMDPDHPDTLLFAADGAGGTSPNGRVYRSSNFGATWDTIAITSFRSPCDIVIVPDSTNIVYVGDGVTGSGLGQMWRSTDGGFSWTSIYSNISGGSEIPTISISRLRNTTAYATAWGSGGVRKTTDYGAVWNPIASTGSTWGTDVAKDDPNVVIYGVYGGGTSYFSTNAGTSFSTSSLSGSNYALLCYDRATILAQQSGGIFTYSIAYIVPVTSQQAVTVLSPNGGEVWQYNSVQNITWTYNNISNVKIDYRSSPGGSWQTLAASVPASAGSYAWTVPNVPSNQARVRISDAADATPLDSSDNYFTIAVAGISSQPSALSFGSVGTGSSRWDTVRIYNTGTATLVVSSVTTDSPNFVAGRTSFSIPVGSSDTLSVVFSPVAVQQYQDTLRIINNSPGSTMLVPLDGQGATEVTNEYPMEASWNMLSLPLLVSDARKSSVFPTAVSDAFSYSPGAGYQQRDTLENGVGYWLKFTSQQDISITGQVVLRETVSVATGWNMIGTVSEPIPASMIQEVPSGVVSSSFYGYNSGYIAADTLMPARSYWVKASQNGMLILDASGLVAQPLARPPTPILKPESEGRAAQQ